MILLLAILGIPLGFIAGVYVTLRLIVKIKHPDQTGI